jgi:hypothetical protein
MKMKKICTFILFCVFYNLSFSATRFVLTNGAWEDDANWTSGAGPSCGDSLIIPPGITVTINSMVDYSACLSPIQLSVQGTLIFQTGKKLYLPCNSNIYIYSGGLITPAAGGGGNSNLIDICNTPEWNAGQGPLTGTSCIPPSPACNAFVLPVSLIYFNARVNDNNVLIEWQTASEKFNDYFTVERSSDGNIFNPIAIIDGAGNSNDLLNYTYIDQWPLPKISYYRLKQTDFNGDFTYSKVVAVRMNIEGLFAIYPNPARQQTAIYY